MSKNVYVFFDGQNLFRAALNLWEDGYHWPNYDPLKLAQYTTNLEPDRKLEKILFYTGVPKVEQNKFWHDFWNSKIRKLLNQRIIVYKGRISNHQAEKGVDVKIAIDIIRYTYEKRFDVGIIFSQDTDLLEAIKLSKNIASQQGRKIEYECAFLYEESQKDKCFGLFSTTWRKITKNIYDSLMDKEDYRK